MQNMHTSLLDLNFLRNHRYDEVDRLLLPRREQLQDLTTWKIPHGGGLRCAPDLLISTCILSAWVLDLEDESWRSAAGLVLLNVISRAAMIYSPLIVVVVCLHGFHWLLF